MKKVTLGFVIGISIGVLGGGLSHAEEVENNKPVGHTIGEVNFIPDDTTPVDPSTPEVVDPTDPDGPSKPVEPGDSGTGGNGNRDFNINWVSNFMFDDMKIGNAMIQYSRPTTLRYTNGDIQNNLANFIQVTDNRGTGTGWHVSAQATPFKEKNGDAILRGAALILNNPGLVDSPISKDLAPSIHDDKLNLLSGDGDAHAILDAGVGRGQGTWSLAWGGEAKTMAYQEEKGVQLMVPMSATPKANTAYLSEITWTLVDGPTT